jgi:hypothetical protein
MHLIDQFSSKFLLLYYNPPIDMIGGVNTWNPEVRSPPTTRIQVPPAFVISFKSTFIQFECRRLLYDKFFLILRIRRIERQTEHRSFKTCVQYHVQRVSAKHGVKDDCAFLWEHAIFRHPPNKHPLTDRSETLHS